MTLQDPTKERVSKKGENDLSTLQELTNDILEHLAAKNDLFIPKYDEVFKEVLERYHADFRKEGAHIYDHKMNARRKSRF